MDDALEARLADAARAASRGVTRFTRFLDPAQQAMARDAARRADVDFSLWGGYAQAERAVCAFSQGDAPESADFPVICLTARWDARFASPGHKDLLGAEMALGIDRALLGDIVLGTDRACLFVHADVSRFVLVSLDSAGRARLKLEETDAQSLELPEPAGTNRRITVPSMRLDALISETWNLARSEAQNLIRRELVKVNYVTETKPDRRAGEGDLLSVRGLGRARIVSETGQTRRGRLSALLFVYER